MIWSATGHRPDKLGGYSNQVDRRLIELALEWLDVQQQDIEALISGLALGWDQAWACAGLTLGLPVWGYAPCRGQESRWPEKSQKRYRALLEEIEEQGGKVIYCHDGPYPGAWCMQKRNERMVDDSNGVLALYNGDQGGGTANCVRYAQERGRLIINLWQRWKEKYPA